MNRHNATDMVPSYDYSSLALRFTGGSQFGTEQHNHNEATTLCAGIEWSVLIKYEKLLTNQFGCTWLHDVRDKSK